MTEAESLQQVDRTCVRYRGRKLSYFSGCDYFRLASHPAVLEAMRDGLKKFGLNVAASRVTTGNHELYERLERRVAEFFDAQDALLLPSGYMTNMVVAQALAGSFSHALIDERAHVCLWDAAQFLNCPVLKFKHRDPNDLARAIRRCGIAPKPVLLTDGMFARDGSAAPLRAYLEILPKGAVILVDDAHGAGVLGQTGKGTLELECVGRRQIIQNITLSKAFGVYGGVVLGTRGLRKKILAKSRLFAGTTPLPLPLANAALAAVEILKSDKSLRQRLVRNAEYVKGALRAAGFQLPTAPGPIVPLHLRHPREAAKLKQALLKARIYPPFVKYPGGPAKGYFRFVLSSEHSQEQLDNLLKVLVGFSLAANR
jgi:7-keto-8-aminopelargonate synthetase-like enzyme